VKVTDLPPGAIGHDGAALMDGAAELAGTALVLARRFATGATLWCVAPGASHHARHVAVEFVHPVIVGKRSLPAMALEDGDDQLGTARLLVRPGDVLLAIGSADDPAVARLLRRGGAWGVETILLAVGAAPSGPSAASADHVLWVGGSDDGALLAYHLLWELTHVVFEHPGLLLAPPPECTDDDACITCSDEGRVVEVRSVTDGHTAVALAGGRPEQVDVSVVDDVAPGDLLLVHAGVALTIVEEDDR